MLSVLAVVAIVVPGFSYVTAANTPGVHVRDGSHPLSLPAGKTYAVYVDDANNSGYFERCAVADANGRPVHMGAPWWTLSSSATETLDFVFSTGSGRLTIDCSVPGEQATVRPVPDLRALVIGVALGAVLGLMGVITLLVWLVARSSRSRDSHRLASVAP